ncbi:MAG TPA: universal stress protein [Solirubrobacteraceae bacterium]|nr:universal stress protein [Solirubrobacteraceae bacterium]
MTATAVEHREPAGDIAATHTLVVGYDGTEPARAAFLAALERAGSGDVVVAVYATAPASSWLGTPHYERGVEAAVQAGQQILDELGELAGGMRAHVQFEMHEGRPAETLLRIAASRDATAIFVGSHSRSRIRTAFGSVSHELLRRSDRPVLVVPT